MKRYCPDCIEELKRQSKKLGNISAWLVCPKCGFRIREMSLKNQDEQEIKNFEETKERINNNTYDKETD